MGVDEPMFWYSYRDAGTNQADPEQVFGFAARTQPEVARPRDLSAGGARLDDRGPGPESVGPLPSVDRWVGLAHVLGRFRRRRRGGLRGVRLRADPGRR